MREIHGDHLSEEMALAIWDAQVKQREFILRGGNATPRERQPSRFFEGCVCGALAVPVVQAILQACGLL